MVESGILGEVPSNFKIIYPPKLLFYLCGAPKSSTKPKGAISVGSFRGQIMGISSGIYGLVISFLSLNSFSFLLGMWVMVLTPYLIAYLAESRSSKN